MNKLDDYFINLERSGDRRASMIRQIDELGLSHFIQRFPAVDGGSEGPFDNTGQNGVWACRRSHEQVIHSQVDQSQLLNERNSRLTGAARRLLFAGDPNIDPSAIEPLLCESVDSPEYRLTMRIYESLWVDG